MTTPTTTDPAKQSVIASLAFWFCLLVAAGLFAIVVLSPKLLTYIELKNEFYANQVRLVALEEQVGYLEKVSDALRNDPEFAKELARVEFGAARPGDERIQVDPSLSLDGSSEEAQQPMPAQPILWPTGPLELLVHHPKIRIGALAAAAVITLLAFTFLPERSSESAPQERKKTRRYFSKIAERYGRSSGDA